MIDSTFISTAGIKPTKTGRTFSEKNVYRVCTAKKLLSSPQRKQIVALIRSTINAPDEYYQTLYEKLIYDFVEFVQILPVNNEARLASLMDEGLFRGLFAIEEYKQDIGEDFDPLMAYLVFTAALLFDVGSVIDNRTIIICNSKGEFQKKWNPHEGKMRIEDGYYRIRRGGGSTAWSSRRLNVLFASLLLPPEGIAWIFNNPHTYNMWISMLNYDREGAGRFSLYQERSLEKLEKVKLSNDFILPLDAEIIQNSEGLAYAEDFIEWLSQGFKNGKISVNATNSAAFLVKEGLLLTSDIFKQYNDAIHRDIKIETMLEQLEKLGFSDGKIQAYSKTASHTGSAPSSMFRDARTAAESSKMVADIAKGTQESKLAFLGTGASLQGPVLHTLLETFVFPTSALSAAVKAGQVRAAAAASKGYPAIDNVTAVELTAKNSSA